MRPSRPFSILDQTVLRIRSAIVSGRWKEGLPGVRAIASEVGVSFSTVQNAIRRLENEGFLIGEGEGRNRVTRAKPGAKTRASRRAPLRVGILLPDNPSTMLVDPSLRSMLSALENKGHHPFFAPKSIRELRGDPRRVLATLDTTPADAWIGVDAPRDVLETIASELEAPFLAWGGRLGGIKLADTGLSASAAVRACVRRLLDLGHRRITLVCPDFWRHPSPGASVTAFRQELAARGIVASGYHVPDWVPSKEGFAELLKSLFSLTPPTAMIVDRTVEAFAVVNFLAARGLSVPRDLSLVLMSEDPAVAWSTPGLAYFKTGLERVLRRTTRWVDACASGTQDRKSIRYDVLFVDGESVAARSE